MAFPIAFFYVIFVRVNFDYLKMKKYCWINRTKIFQKVLFY